MNRRDFIKKTGLTIAGVTALSGYAHAGVLLRNQSMDFLSGGKRPNIIFIMTDQHRFDGLGCAGNSVIKTPHLDALAADGAMFTRAYTSLPTCTPARTSVLTGLSPWGHGMLGYGSISTGHSWEYTKALTNAGYYLYALGKNHWGSTRSSHGFKGTMLYDGPAWVQDYDNWFHEKLPTQDPEATGIGGNDYRAREYIYEEYLHPTVWLGNNAVEFIDQYDRNEPLFLKISFQRPHSPNDPPSRFWNMYDVPEEMPDPWIGDWAGVYESGSTSTGTWYNDFGIDQVRESRRGYYGNISCIDEQIGKIVQALKKKGMYDNALILFTADHGDMMGDHHHWRKSYAYEGSSHVPMLVRWPENMKTTVARGSQFDELVELRDIAPTFMDAAKLPLPDPPAIGERGDSMLKLIRGKNVQWREWLDLEHTTCYDAANNWNAIINDRYKYIFWCYTTVIGKREMLFDLQNDPHELVDLSESTDPEHVAALADLKNTLIQHLSVRDTRYVDNGELVIGRGTITYAPHFPG